MTDYTWVGGSGSFDDPNQWENDTSGTDGDGAPGSGDFAHIGAAGLNTNAGTITGSGSVSEMDIDGGVTFSDGTITIGSSGLIIDNGDNVIGSGATLDASADGITAFSNAGGTIDVDGGTVDSGHDEIGTGNGNGAKVKLDITGGGTWQDTSLTMGPTEATVLKISGGSTLDQGSSGGTSLDNCTATVSGSTWNTGGIFLGEQVASDLTVEGSTLTLTGALALSNLSSAKIEGGTLKAGEISVNGSLVNLTGGVAVTLKPADHGTGLFVTGSSLFYLSGSTLTSTGISDLAGGISTVSGGAHFQDGELTLAAGTLNVSGSGSGWTDTGLSGSAAIIGDAGIGTVNIKGGAQMTDDSAVLVGSTYGSIDAQGTVVVTGKGSAWTVKGDLGIGDNAAGTVKVENDATLTLEGSKHIFGLGLEAGGTGLLVVNSGTVTSAGEIEAGGDANAQITVEAGGKLEGQGIVEFGVGKGTESIISVESNAKLTAGANLVIGDHGDATLTTTSGTKVAVGKSLVLGVHGSSHGTLDIQGGTLTATSGTAIGGSESAAGGTGTLKVSDSGVLDAGDKLTVWADGTLTLDKTSSADVGATATDLPGTLLVSKDGTVVNHGKISADTLYLDNEGSYAASDKGASHGDLNLSSGLITDDNSTLDLSKGGSIEVGDPAHSHAGAVSVGSNGAVTLDGAHFDAATWIEGGVVIVQATGASGDQAITFHGAGSALQIDAGVTLANTIKGFAGGDTVDFRGVNFDSDTKLNFSDGKLTVADGTHSETLDLQGTYTQSEFHLAKDGHGGTDVTFSSGANDVAQDVWENHLWHHIPTPDLLG